MTSSKLILIFLGIIIVIILILTSNKISAALRARFGNIFPDTKITTTETVPSPTPTLVSEINQPTPTYYIQDRSSPNQEIPATGPGDFLWFMLGISLLTGLTLQKIKVKSREK